MEETTYKVYVQADSNNVITNILSDLESTIMKISIEGWTQIDEGQGDKFAHAQGNYFAIDDKKLLMDSNGKYNYKLVDGKPVELTNAEKESLFPTETIVQPPTNADLQAQIFNLTTQLVNGGVI